MFFFFCISIWFVSSGCNFLFSPSVSHGQDWIWLPPVCASYSCFTNLPTLVIVSLFITNLNYVSGCVVVLHIVVFAFSLSLTRLIVNTLSCVYCSYCYLSWSVYLSFLSFFFSPGLPFILLICRRSLSGYDSFVYLYIYINTFSPSLRHAFPNDIFSIFLKSNIVQFMVDALCAHWNVFQLQSHKVILLSCQKLFISLFTFTSVIHAVVCKISHESAFHCISLLGTLV